MKELEIEKVKSIKNEYEVWRFLGSARKKKSVTENTIGKGEWKEHFRILLEGSDERKVGQIHKQEEEESEK